MYSIDNGVQSSTLVILLHGFGADEVDLLGLANLFNGARVISYRGSIDLMDYGYGGGFAWFPLEFTPWGIRYDFAGLQKALEDVTTELSIITPQFPKVYLCGFSQGAIMAHGLLLSQKLEISGIAGLSGRFVPEIFHEEAKKHLAGKVVFLSHGIEDEVIPIKSGQEIVNFYRDTKAVLTHAEFEMGHEINLDCQQKLREWFSAL